MNCRRLLLTTILASLFAVGAGNAQVIVSPYADIGPFNNYSAARIADGFSTIVNNGGTLISGSAGLGPYGYILNLTLPMNFYFLGTQYTQGYNLKVSTNGYVGFNGSGYTGGYDYIYYGVYWFNNYAGNGHPSYNNCIFAYATDLQTTGVADGGIYWKVAGSAPNRVFTVEWRVGSGSRYPGQVGNFQILMYENTGKIQWYFGSNNINIPYVQHDSYNYAVCGIKKLGDAYYYGTVNPIANNSRQPANVQDRHYTFSNPSLQPDTIAYSSLGIMFYANQVYYADVYNFVNGYAQKWHQHDFPTLGGNRIGFQMSPVFDDMSTDSVWTTPTAIANAYGVNTTITINARFRNIGVNNRTNVPVQADVYRNGTGGGLVYSSTTTNVPVSPGAQFNSINAAFTPSIGSGVTSQTGVYTVKVYTKLITPIDQDFANDTVTISFFVTKPNDVMAFQILQPYANQAPLYYQYPTGVPVPLEVRFLNIGTVTQFNVPVGYTISNSSGQIVSSGTGTVQGAWLPIAYRDIVFSGGWTPTAPGRYYLKAFTMLTGDENPSNDTLTPWPTLGFPFDVAYEIETGIDVTAPVSPNPSQCYPIGKPVPVFAVFLNFGISDATNVPANVTITGPAGNIVYNRNVTILGIVASTGPTAPGRTTQVFPDFIPPTSGTYSVTVNVNYPNDPVTTNNSFTWSMCVKPPLLGTIRVGTGERFRTIQEAWDSASYYGVGGNVIFDLIEDVYTVNALSNDGTVPALDLRRKVVGIGPNATILFRPSANKTMVTVNMKSASGIGMWMGQLDTVNPSGYVMWDGGASKALTFTYENTSTNPSDPYGGYTRSVPFLLGRGASNYTVKNSQIYPFNVFSARRQYLNVALPTYNQSFNQFTYQSDFLVQVSTAFMLRNSLRPTGQVTGADKGGATGQAVTPDTLRNQNNVIDGNIIDGFGYGIVSVGMGPLYVVGQGRYVEYSNQNNQYNNNTITNVARAGVFMVWEKGSQIIGNTIRGVDNTTLVGPPAHIAGIWASAGGNATNNRGYNTDLRIERNKISRLFSGTGNATAIWIETAENVFTSPSNVIYRFPTNGATNMQIWNNMLWNYKGQEPISGSTYSTGIGLTPEAATRIDFVTTGNKVQDNTIFNAILSNTTSIGVNLQRAGASVMNNIIDMTSPAALNGLTGLMINTVNAGTTVTTDYNLFYTPAGNVAQLNNLSVQGFNIPSPPVSKTLEQWRYTSKQDINSVYGNITPEFMNVNPGSEDLHLNPALIGGLASNRGVAINGLTTDMDLEQRSPSGSTLGTPDIGADEYNGAVYNYDLQAVSIMAPHGHQAATGQYSDAEYIMTDSMVALGGRVRNLGGQPLLSNSATLSIDRWTGSSWISTGISVVRPVSVNIASYQTLDFGGFQPQTLRELAQNDPFYGTNPNVTPLYRMTLTTGGQDQFTANNVYQKLVRFYVQRSTRKALVAVKYWAPATNPTSIANVVDMGNKLNADTITAALNRGGWDRTNGIGTEDFDLFERDKWPTYADNFKPWVTIIWAQGQEATGLDAWERSNLKVMLDSRDLYNRSNVLIAGQDVARLHDVALSSTNGQISDQDFVNNYLRTQNRGNTNPALYNGLRVQGVKVNPGVYERIAITGVTGDNGPMPAVVRATSGNGVAYPSHRYVDQAVVTADTAMGVATFGSIRNAIYYAVDWRHFGRLTTDSRSGAMRIAMGALDLFEQHKGILPINLVSLDAYQSSPKAVTVAWQTSSEIDVTSMEVERAEMRGTDVGVFRMVDKRNALGSALSGSKYNVVDEGVQQGKTYRYRLISIGLDGSRVNEGEKEVHVTSASQTGGMELTVSPNPVTTDGSLTVTYRVGSGEKVRVVVYDELGKQVMLVKEGIETTGTGYASVTGLISGTYTLVVESQTGARVFEKFVVQK